MDLIMFLIVVVLAVETCNFQAREEECALGRLNIPFLPLPPVDDHQRLSFCPPR